ncbi:MAG: cobyrinate a,c-diamide synthase [Leptolyngbyaceae cyanobacterium CSU_1_3]|nr:cobyrinate a,c-diamide synthase [Leptolyngbyaceae cyanobacterium CSU_1_3]
MSLIVAGERSGVGKTTVTLALLSALQQQSQRVQSFKVGPDYIDPMFHHYVTGRSCRNLDPVLTSEAYVQQCFALHTKDAEYALIEGVMGLFDGATGTDDFASTAHIARLLNLPVLLILNCSSLSRSIAAIAHGYSTFDPRIQIAGVVLNRVGSDRHLELLTDALKPLNLPILGVLRRQDDIVIPDRHLGLIPTAELTDLKALLDRLAHLGKTCFDWSKLLPLLAPSPSPPCSSPVFPSLSSTPRLAIARDSAFSFYYADNLDLLQQLGAELVDWSPLRDAALPEGVQGLYFGGGFPEVFASELAENRPARDAVQAAIRGGMPTYAECGGLMYLCEQIVDFDGRSHPMTGILPTTATMGKRLTLGYRQATALQNSPMVKVGDRLWGHEFHRSIVPEPEQPLFALQGYQTRLPLAPEGWQRYQVHASYTHLHFGAQPELPSRFLQHCIMREGRSNDRL